MSDSSTVAVPEIPSWLQRVCRLLEDEYPGMWQRFAAESGQAEVREAVNLDLLRSAEPLPEPNHPELYERARSLAETLDLDARDLCLYRSKQAEPAARAAVAADPLVPRIIFNMTFESVGDGGPDFLLAHELAHVKLWNVNEGRLLVALQMLSAAGCQDHAAPVFRQTLRVFSDLVEIWCDCVATALTGSVEPLLVAGEPAARVEIERQAALRQASVQLRSADGRPGQPLDLAGRLAAVRIWQAAAGTAWQTITDSLRTTDSLAGLDLPGQQAVARITRNLIRRIGEPKWMRNEASLAMARQYFADFGADEFGRAATEPAGDPGPWWESYLLFVLLDFVTANRQLQEPALAHVLGLADEADCGEACRELARRELRLRKKQIEQIENNRQQLFAEATVQRASAQPDDRGP